MPTTPATSSDAEQPTSDQDDSSAATATDSTTTSTTRWNRALQNIDLEALSTRSQAIQIEIGELMPDGYRINEIATELNVTPSWVSQRLDELRSEILLQTGGFLPLTDTEYAALKASIAEHGQQVPVLLGSTGLLDGKHRILALRELGITTVLAQFVTDANPETERRISRTVNASRRMLNRAQKEALVRAELEHNWTRSSRQIALDCGCSHDFVETIRRAVRAERETMNHEPGPDPDDDEPVLATIAGTTAPRSVGEAVNTATVQPHEEARVGRDGKRRIAYAQRTNKLPPTARRLKSCVAILTCAHGQRHELIHHGIGRNRTYELIPIDD